MTEQTSKNKLKQRATALTKRVGALADKTAVAVGDLDGDGKIGAADARLALGEAGKVAKSVARAPLTKDVATYAAVGAAIALPLPVIGPAVGAAVGASLGLFRNMTRHETLVPDTSDPIAELERLHGLKERGIITDEEFLTQKRKLLK